ncbi:SPASM domain-containing protein, partial [bacterium]|nr:SPASM domain-containing protein [bacterium]
KAKPTIGIQILKMKETDAEIEQFMNKWDYMDKARKMINYRNRSQELSKIENESGRSQASQKLNKELWDTFYTKAELPVEHAIIGHFNRYYDRIEDRSVIDVTPLKRFACRQLENSLSILWNGDVIMCQQDFDGKYVFANIKNSSLIDIWESQELKDLRLAHLKGEYNKYPLCVKCKEWYIPMI